MVVDNDSIVQPDHSVNGHLANGEPPARVFTVHTRPRWATNASSIAHTGATPLEALDAALSYGEYAIDDQPVVYWNKRYALACADIDFHGEHKFKPNDLFAAFHYVYPQPLRLWRSHGGGVKAVFVDAGCLTAEEAAGLYCYGLRQSGYAYGCTDLEVKWETFLPGYRRGDSWCSEVMWRDFAFADPGDSDALRELTGSRPTEAANEELREEWLEEKNWNLGQRYPHTECPIDPCEISGNDPVVVFDNGVYCYRCGRLTPYTALVAGVTRKRSLVRQAAWSFVPWDQAQHYLRNEYVPDKIAELVYRAAIKWVHAKAGVPERKLQLVFCRNSSRANLALVEGGVWVNANDMKVPVGSKLELRIQDLPQLYYVQPATPAQPAADGKPAVRAKAEKEGGSKRSEYARLFEGQAIDDLDWVPLTRLFGVDMWGQRELDDERILVVVPGNPPFKWNHHKDYTLEWAVNRINEHFPGINLPFLRTCLVAKGFTQRGFTEPPRIWATGQSGSGKTSTWLLASEIGMCGAKEIKLSPNVDWFL
jgi:hypothetical protein